jgi:hypothetical protein
MNQHPSPEQRAALWQKAKEIFADTSSDDIELDDVEHYVNDELVPSRFSLAEDGCWVQAWVFVRDEEA